MSENFYEFRVRRIRRKFAPGSIVAISNEVDAAIMFRLAFNRLIGDHSREHFLVASVSSQNKLIGVEIVALGGLSGVDVHPRETFRAAILSGAAAVLLCHNHPSGSLQVSHEDMALTARFVAAGALLGIPVLDHMIITEDRAESIRECCPSLFE